MTLVRFFIRLSVCLPVCLSGARAKCMENDRKQLAEKFKRGWPTSLLPAVAVVAMLWQSSIIKAVVLEDRKSTMCKRPELRSARSPQSVHTDQRSGRRP